MFIELCTTLTCDYGMRFRFTGIDNLKTLQLVSACYESAEERRSVKPSEIS